MAAVRYRAMKARLAITPVARVQPPSRPAADSPIPRHPKRGRMRRPRRASGQNRMKAWAATPTVDIPTSQNVCADVQFSSVCGVVRKGPNR